MIVVSTTSLLCQGDDFIRDGVRELLPTSPLHGEVWVNRTGCKGETNLWRVIRNMPDRAAYLPHARAMLFAGTPAWLAVSEVEWYDACIASNVPMWLVGVGGKQHRPETLARAKGVIEVATARDADGLATLREYGIECERFLDPGFHAPYFYPRDRRFDVVFTYRDRGAHHEADRATRVAAYLGLYAKFRDRIDAVVVHEPNEIPIARELFGVEPFFSHDHRRYADIYCAARHYIGGRLHGAIPTLAGGGTAHMLYCNAKTEGVTAHGAWLPVTCHKHDDWEAITLDAEGDDVQEHIQADFAAHAAYLRARTQ